MKGCIGLILYGLIAVALSGAIGGLALMVLLNILNTEVRSP